MANIDVLKGKISDELFEQVKEATKDSKIKLADLTSGLFVGKDKYDALETQLTSTQGLLNSKTAEYDQLAKSAGNNDELKQQIATLKADNQKAVDDLKKQYEAQLKKNTVATQIIKDYRPKDVDDVMRLVDLDKVEIKDDKITGLSEQVDNIKEKRGYYFENQTKPQATGLNHNNNSGNDDPFLKGFNS